MDITEMFSDSYFSYPFSNFSRIAVLGVLFCTGVFLVIPAIFAGGYLLRIIENTINGNYELPPFDDWKKMFFDGLKVAAVIIFYALPGLITELLLFLLLQFNYSLMLSNEFTTIICIIIALFYISAYILSITAIPRMAHKGQLKAALDIRMVIKDIKHIGLRKYTLSLAGLTVMAAYLLLFSGFLHGVLASIGMLISLNMIIIDSIANFMIFPLIIASQGRLMGLIYLERN